MRGKTPEKAADNLTVLNIRNFPDDLKWACRMCANYERVTLQDFVIRALRDATEKRTKAMGLNR